MIRVGLVGYGMAGRVFHGPLIAAVPGIAIAKLASGKPEAVRADLGDVSIVPTAQALIADAKIDLVVVATPTATHAPLAIAALQAGKHVVVEKTFATSLAEAREVVAVAKAQNRRLWVFHNGAGTATMWGSRPRSRRRRSDGWCISRRRTIAIART